MNLNVIVIFLLRYCLFVLKSQLNLEIILCITDRLPGKLDLLLRLTFYGFDNYFYSTFLFAFQEKVFRCQARDVIDNDKGIRECNCG